MKTLTRFSTSLSLSLSLSLSRCLALSAVLSFACATVGSGPPTVAMRIAGNVPDATIWIDDRLAGRMSDFSKSGKRLGVGFHRIEVRAPGHYSFFQEVDIKPGTDVSLQADLHALLQ